jgi:hypothetical protein
MNPEEVTIPTDRLSDGEIRGLVRIYRAMAADPTMPAVLACWYSWLVIELHEVLLGRENRWLDITSDRTTWPPDWKTAVAALE